MRVEYVRLSSSRKEKKTKRHIISVVWGSGVNLAYVCKWQNGENSGMKKALVSINNNVKSHQ